MLNALREIGLEKVPNLLDDAFVSAMQTQGAHVIGQNAMANGAIVSGMLWGAFAVFLVDKKIVSAAITSLVAAVLTGFGIIHDNSLHGFDFSNAIIWGYVILAVLLIIGSRLPLEQEEEIEPLWEDTDQKP